MLMRATYSYSYRAMTASYDGTGEVTFNCAPDDDAQEIALDRAKNKVARNGCFDVSLVKISDLQVAAA